jgi:integrase
MSLSCVSGVPARVPSCRSPTPEHVKTVGDRTRHPPQHRDGATQEIACYGGASYRHDLGGRTDLKGFRDRALLLFGFAGAFRRSEIVALDCKDLEETELGFRVTIRHSKTDREGLGQTIAIVRGSIACPVSALGAWLNAAGITDGPVFRSIRRGGHVGARLAAQSVADIVKDYAKRSGLDPTLFAGHSLRAGFLTSAAKRGASIFKMVDQSRHRSVETLRGYVRDAEIFKEHAGTGLL